MRARIHRGAAEVGGSCVELESENERLVLDLGRPLWAEADDEVPLPAITGLLGDDGRGLAGVVITHGHPDHYGLIEGISPEVPVYVGEAAARILNEAAFFTRADSRLSPAGFLADGRPMQLGRFEVTPFLVDHSAFDAHALLVEADGRRLFYTGDLRAHGRKPGAFQRLLDRPPKRIDVLLLEGTRLGRERPAAEEPTSEVDVEERCVELFRRTEGMVLACYSPQNIDRYVSLSKAALRADRDLVIDLYTATVAEATGRDSIPQADWDRIKVFVPRSQRVKVKNAKAFERIDSVRRARIFPEQLAAEPQRLVMTFRASMATELERAGCLTGASALWSMWPGYLREPSSERLKLFLKRHGIPLAVIHASGHATPADLRRLVDSIGPDRIVPIHTAAPERFAEAFGRAELHPDGEWWEV
jgi:ribonuclease J